MALSISPEKKLAGVLAPLFSLRGAHDPGIGDLAALEELIGWAANHGLGFIQMLPIQETGGDHSPYNTISSVAIEPSTIDCRPARLPDLPNTTNGIDQPPNDQLSPSTTGPVDYGTVKVQKRQLLEAAFSNFSADRRRTKRKTKFANFLEGEEEWLPGYALHHALMDHFGYGEDLPLWLPEHRTETTARTWLAAAPTPTRKKIEARIRFHSYVQWIAHSQWREIRVMAERHGIALIGDIPVGVSIHSVDVWSWPQLFDVFRSSGAPPEKVFAADPFTGQWGQNWGFPLYDWFAMSHDNFRWWRRRLQLLNQIFDFIRVDHALGFFRIYSFPWRPERNAEFLGLSPEEAKLRTDGRLPGFVPHPDDTDENREANRKHGEVLLGILAEETPAERLIAEDLGEVPPYVRPTLAAMGMPGFKIPQWENDKDGRLISGKDYPRISITTYATHDHPPMKTTWEELRADASGSNPEKAEPALRDLRALMGFCGWNEKAIPAYGPKVLGALLDGIFRSNSWLAAVTINDLLGTDLRFNTPGTMGGSNWTARIAEPIAQWDLVYSAEIAAWRNQTNRDNSEPS